MNPDFGQNARISQLRELLDAHSDKRVVVVGTTCTGKSTMLAAIPGAQDMDQLIFPRLSSDEAAFVCQTPWTEQIGRTMNRLVKARVKTAPGCPIFGTVVLESDLVVLLKISDTLLRERTTARKADFQDAKNMQRRIEAQARESGIMLIEFEVG